jgi:hypothetical protein
MVKYQISNHQKIESTSNSRFFFLMKLKLFDDLIICSRVQQKKPAQSWVRKAGTAANHQFIKYQMNFGFAPF